jgi:hypothetical protein
MRNTIRVVLLGAVCLLVSYLLISCDNSNPAPEIGYRIFLSANPDSIPNTGAVSTITARVLDVVDSTQVGGFILEFHASGGDITGTAVSSATEPTGTYPTVYFDCNACQDSVTVILISGAVYDSTGTFLDDDTTRVVVYIP